MQKWLSSSLFVVFISLHTSLFAQTYLSDIDKIQKQTFTNESFQKKREVKFMLSKRKNVLLRYNPVSLTFGALLYFYQKVISQQIGANCPYEISCSAFAKKGIQQYGFIKGMAIAADRLTRCTQFGAYDLKLIIDLNDNGKLIDPVEDYRHVHE